MFSADLAFVCIGLSELLVPLGLVNGCGGSL